MIYDLRSLRHTEDDDPYETTILTTLLLFSIPHTVLSAMMRSYEFDVLSSPANFEAWFNASWRLAHDTTVHVELAQSRIYSAIDHRILS